MHSSLNAVLGGIKNNELLSVLHKGESVLTAPQTENFGNILQGLSYLNIDRKTPQPSEVVQSDNAIDTEKLEVMMGELVSLMKNGGIAINLDGRRVSEGLMAAYSKV
jgi:hypothetical protein